MQGGCVYREFDIVPRNHFGREIWFLVIVTGKDLVVRLRCCKDAENYSALAAEMSKITVMAVLTLITVT